MRNFIYILALSFLTIIILLNILFTSYLDISEHVEVNYNNFIYDIGIIFLVLLLYFSSKYIDSYDEQLKKRIITVFLSIFIIFNIIWVIVVNPKVVGDSVHVCNLAQIFYRENSQELLYNLTYLGVPLYEYMQSYHQQISLAFVFSIFFKVIHLDIMESLRVLNIISNILIIMALCKINIQLSKKYKTNTILLFVMILTFISLPLLSTFIYGDIPSIALCLFSVYFMIKYTENKNIKYYILASVLTMVAYMMRMNSLIFIIATVIYLSLNLTKEYKTISLKKIWVNIFLIIFYVIISIIPSLIIQNYYLDQYNLKKNKASPTIRYILMAMEESPRGNGWYNEDIAIPAIANPETIKDEYYQKVCYRLKYFANNLNYTFKFYTIKIASMWTENTYSAIRNNTTIDNTLIDNSITILTFYQKSLLVLICACCLINLIQNRKNLSLEVIFLITIFIGGFVFHILWEAKSRYIIPYIIILIPLASINIKQSKSKNFNRNSTE